MKTFFICYLIGMILLTLLMLIPLFKEESVYNRFVGILVMCTNVILILVLIGFVDGREDMYVDIALSFAVLGFVSSVIVAKFMSGGGNRDDDGN